MRQLRAGRARIAQLVERLFGPPLRWQIGTLVVVGLIVIFALFGLLGSAFATDVKQRTLDDWLGIGDRTPGAPPGSAFHLTVRT